MAAAGDGTLGQQGRAAQGQRREGHGGHRWDRRGLTDLAEVLMLLPPQHLAGHGGHVAS